MGGSCLFYRSFIFFALALQMVMRTCQSGPGLSQQVDIVSGWVKMVCVCVCVYVCVCVCVVCVDERIFLMFVYNNVPGFEGYNIEILGLYY